MRSSSRSWNLSQAAFQSLFHLPVVSSSTLTAASYSLLVVARLICVFSSFALFFRSSCPMTMCACARKPLILRQSCSYRSRALLTVDVCCIFSLSSFSMPFCTIFLRSFIPPAKAASGSSSSVFICCAMLWCALPMDSTSARMTSHDSRRVPVSQDPRGLRDRFRSFREYSSSIAERAA